VSAPIVGGCRIVESHHQLDESGELEAAVFPPPNSVLMPDSLISVQLFQSGLAHRNLRASIVCCAEFLPARKAERPHAGRTLGPGLVLSQNFANGSHLPKQSSLRSSQLVWIGLGCIEKIRPKWDLMRAT
jgi:hypothetical protein